MEKASRQSKHLKETKIRDLHELTQRAQIVHHLKRMYTQAQLRQQKYMTILLKCHHGEFQDFYDRWKETSSDIEAIHRTIFLCTTQPTQPNPTNQLHHKGK